MHSIRAFEKGNLLVQPLTNDLDIEVSELISGLVRIFSKGEIIRYNPNRQLADEDEAKRYVASVISGYNNKTNFDYFIFRKSQNGALSVIGTINMLSPKNLGHIYPIIGLLADIKKHVNKTWMIEYYLDTPYQRKGIMKTFVNTLTNELFTQGAEAVCALVSDKNIPSNSLLKKIGFTKDSKYRDGSGQVLWWKKNS